MQDRVVRVRISEFRVAEAPESLRVLGLGSCVAIAIYDPGLRIGGLAHVLLPGPPPDPMPAGFNISKYADHALSALLSALLERGCDPARLVAKIAGGANMFTGAEEMGNMSGALAVVKSGIGDRNVAAVREQLAARGIPLAGEEVGGSRGRTITFEVSTGRLVITHARGGSQVI